MSSYYEKFLATGEVQCIDEEIPFEIPNGWEWCRIRDISNSYIGLTYRPTDISQTGTIVLRSSNIQEGKLCLRDIVRVNINIPEKLWVQNNDILICARNGSKKLVGKSAIIDGINEPMTFGAFMAICKTPFYKYVYLFLQSDCFFSQLREVSGTTTINQLTQNNFNTFLIPLPSALEQQRIIAKVEELISELRKQVTIIIVTHNMQQAARVSDKTAFFYMGEMVEYDDTKVIFTNPRKEATQNYITGRFG